MEPEIKIVPKDQSFVKVVCDFGIMQEMYDYFSFFVDGYQFNPKFKYSNWDGKIHLMKLNGDLPFGLVDQAKKFASNMMYELEISEDINPPEIMSRKEFDEWLNEFDIYSGNTKITPHWYQADAAFESINKRRLIANLPTSAGKSLIQSLLAKWYTQRHGDKILLLVPTVALVDQMINDFVDYRLFERDDCLGVRGGTAKDSNARIYVSTWQTAIKQPKAWFAQFGMLMCDECHLATGKSISEIVTKMNNCVYKIGLSGSLRDGKANVLQYLGLFGSIYKPVSTADLMEEGQVSKLKINACVLKYPLQEAEACKPLDYQQELKYLLTHEKRNTFITRLALKLSKGNNQNTLVMFKTIAHGKELYERLRKEHGDKVHYISGETKADDRTTLKTIAEEGEGLIIVASYGVMSTGVSIKRLHNVIFAHPTKSKVTNLQTIGRVLRKHQSKDEAVLFDIIDNLAIPTKSKTAKKKYKHINYVFKHALVRIELYIREKFNYSMTTVEF